MGIRTGSTLLNLIEKVSPLRRTSLRPGPKSTTYNVPWPPYTQSAKRADFLETLELPLGPGSGRPGTGRGGSWESVWCWAGSGVLETGGQIGGDSFENKSRVGFFDDYTVRLGLPGTKKFLAGFFQP